MRFGVVWSFTFKALAMVVLRFKEPRPRRISGSAQRAGRQDRGAGRADSDLSGAADGSGVESIHEAGGHGCGPDFALVFFAIFLSADAITRSRSRDRSTSTPSNSIRQRRRPFPQNLNLTKPYRKLVAIRSTQNLYMLEKCFPTPIRC